MKRLVLTTICVLSVLWATATRAESIALVEKSLTELLGAGYTAAGTLLETNMSNGNLHSEVHSQAFTDGDKYVYLYQIFNTGATENSSVELYTLGEFAGPLTAGNAGYLSGTLPTGFSSSGQVPEGDAFADSLPGGLDVSFYYTKRYGYEISPGETSRVMFIRSAYSPGAIIASVIDHDSASGPVIGAVPEPTIFGLLVSGGLAALAYTIRRKR